MDLGFETIGNATLVCHDRGPLLVTDPWITGSAYFGSWGLSHEIPSQQMEAIRSARYVWLSHGHPDHLSPASLESLRGRPILIADHYGGRIASGLRADGHEVRILKSGEWTQLSERVRALCVADYCQDSVLLLDVGGTLVVDANDASDRGAGELVRELAPRYARSFLLRLTGFGDADMIHFFDEAGKPVPPHAAARRPVGPEVAESLAYYGLKTFVPFSSMHRYERTDSAWANEHKTGIEEHAEGFDPAAGEMLPAYVRVDLAADRVTPIEPAERPEVLLPPEDFGDDWSDELEPGDVQRLRAYFERVEHLRAFLGFLNFRVGGRDNFVDLARERFDRGITFEAPRASLMTCIQHDVFDDMLIGNYMKTTLHGPWKRTGEESLYPDFTPFVTKYGDNGGAYSAAELRRYFAHYRDSGFFGAGPTPGAAEIHASIQLYLDPAS